MLLETDGLTKQFGHLLAVDEIDLMVAEGELVSIIGPNGAGKTTLFNLISGGLDPTAGRIRFKGEDVTGRTPHEFGALGIGRSFQITNIFPNLSVMQNLQVAAQRRTDRPWNFYRRADSFEGVKAECEEILADLQLSAEADRPAAALSHGDKRHLEIGITLATKPELLLLDEPTAGMSPEETTRTIELIDELRTTYTIVLIEHDMDVVSEVSDRIMVMYQGSKLAEGETATVMSDERVQEAYLGGV